MRVKLAWLLGVLCAANGVFMLLAPVAWYQVAPGVPETGPLWLIALHRPGRAYCR
jgi:hypothetical protein